MFTIHSLTPELIIRSAVFTSLAFAVICLLLEKLPRLRSILWFSFFVVVVHLAWLLLAGPAGAVKTGYPLTALRIFCVTWTLSALFIAVVGVALLLLLWAIRLVKYLRFLSKSASWKASPVNAGRRQFLAGALPLTAVAVSGGGVLNGMKPFEVRHIEMKLSGLPKALDGFRIGQSTDLHVGNFIDPDRVVQAVETLNALGVDLQVMTGDLIDDKNRIPETFAALERCTAPHGLLAILGNHEKYFCLPEVLRAYEDIASRGRVRLLVDSNVALEHKGQPFRIVGVDFPAYPGVDHPLSWHQTRAWMKRSAEKGFSGIHEDETVFCLSHHPDFFPIAAERGALLTIAGHTHGGQVALMGISPFSFFFRFILGRYQLGNSHLYVSGGTGHWIPIRIGVPTEITVLTLRSV